MSASPERKKRSYSSVYKIYRRLRYVRYKRKVLREARLAFLRQEEEQRRQLRTAYQGHIQTERELARERARSRREEEKKLRLELRAEIMARKTMLKSEIREQSHTAKERARIERKRSKKERRRLLKHYFRNRTRNFILSFRSIRISNIRQKLREFRQSLPARKKFALIAFNSTILYLGSYLFLFLLSQAITVLAASLFEYPTVVHYYEIYFNINPSQWYHDSVKTIFSAGPIINLVIGLSFLIIYRNIREMAGIFKLFFLWGFLHAINMLFGGMLVGTLFETGVGHVISWMYVMDTGRVLYSVISIFILVVAGLMTTRSFLISGNSYLNEVNENNRSFFMIPQVFLPYIFGNALLILVRQPKFIYYDTFIGLTLILCILPVMVTYRSYHELYFEEEEKVNRVTWPGLILLAVLLLIFRGLLAIGLHFGD